MWKTTSPVAVAVGWLLLTHVPAEAAGTPRIAQAPTTSVMPGRGVIGAVTVRGTVEAIDRQNGTVTLKGPQGRTLALDVRDRQKLDQIKVGDPVVATYAEAVMVQAKKAGSALPSVTTHESRISSKPGETPAGAVRHEVTVIGTITGIDPKAETVTVKGPQGNTETLKVEDPKNLQGLAVGDLAELTYVQALAVALDRTGG